MEQFPDRENQATPTQRCIFILSMKSCGSSVLQKHISRIAGAKLMAKTQHFENETLYWVKAAAVLGIPQVPMENSRVPISMPRAERLLRRMVSNNAPDYSGELETEADMFSAWSSLVRAGGGNFVEKSPHHLYQPKVVELMERYADQERSFDVRFIGLVRNPTDMLYSSWRRFGVLPEREERHWIRSYKLLRSFHERRPELVSIVRYEDLVEGKVDLSKMLGVERIKGSNAGKGVFHSASIRKWLSDSRFGYTPSAEALELAKAYGYTEEEVVNPSGGPWWLRRVPRAAAYAAFSRLPFAYQKRMKWSAKAIARR